jgi:hypothetical protein
MTTPLRVTQAEGQNPNSGRTAVTTDGTKNRSDIGGNLPVLNPYLRHVSPAGLNTTGLRADILRYEQEPLVPNTEEADKHKHDKLAACKHVIESQPQTLQASIQTFAKKMVSSTNDLHEVEERLKPFTEWDKTKDPANPCYLPQNFRFKSKLNFTSKEALGDPEAEALILEMTEATMTYKKKASELSLKGHILDTKLMKRRRLESFATGAKKLIDPFVEFAKLTGPGKTGSRDNNTLAGIFLCKYTEEQLDDEYLRYLRTTKEELQSTILSTIAMDPNGQSSLLDQNFSEEENAIYETVAKTHLSSFFVAVTYGLQKYLDNERAKRVIATKMKAYTAKKDIREATEATAQTIADEDTLTPRNLAQLIDDRIVKVSKRKNSKGGRKIAQTTKPRSNSTTAGLTSKTGRQKPNSSKRNRDAETVDINSPAAKRAKTPRKQAALKTHGKKKSIGKKVTFSAQHKNEQQTKKNVLKKAKKNPLRNPERQDSRDGSRKGAQKDSSANKQR